MPLPVSSKIFILSRGACIDTRTWVLHSLDGNDESASPLSLREFVVDDGIEIEAGSWIDVAADIPCTFAAIAKANALSPRERNIPSELTIIPALSSKALHGHSQSVMSNCMSTVRSVLHWICTLVQHSIPSGLESGSEDISVFLWLYHHRYARRRTKRVIIAVLLSSPFVIPAFLDGIVKLVVVVCIRVTIKFR